MPVKHLHFPPTIPFNVAHAFFLRKILLNGHLIQYPPSDSYQQSFWKWALAKFEGLFRSDEDGDIDERIYAHYLSLITSTRESETPLSSFITYYWKPPKTHDYPVMEERCETITLLESRTTIEAGTTGLRTWRASLVLAQYLIQHPQLVDSSNVLELGSGTGFIGILVASLQLHAVTSLFDHKIPSVYLTDVNSTVLERCKNNIRLSCNKSLSHPNIHYKSLDWLDSLSGQEGLKPFFSGTNAQTILGADIVFDPELVPPLVKTISLALSTGPTRVAIVALTVRNEETLNHFLNEIGKVLKAEEVACDSIAHQPLQIPDQVDAERKVKIFRITSGSDASSPTI